MRKQKRSKPAVIITDSCGERRERHGKQEHVAPGRGSAHPLPRACQIERSSAYQTTSIPFHRRVPCSSSPIRSMTRRAAVFQATVTLMMRSSWCSPKPNCRAANPASVARPFPHHARCSSQPTSILWASGQSSNSSRPTRPIHCPVARSWAAHGPNPLRCHCRELLSAWP